MPLLAKHIGRETVFENTDPASFVQDPKEHKNIHVPIKVPYLCKWLKLDFGISIS